jgi:hypothetical protein
MSALDQKEVRRKQFIVTSANVVDDSLRLLGVLLAELPFDGDGGIEDEFHWPSRAS